MFRIRRLLIVLAAVCLLVAVGRGHGGLPVSQQLFWDGRGTLLAARYWGLFVERSGRWTWICDEAVAPDLASSPLRAWARGAGGTLYVTDPRGVIVSRDGGCSWAPATGEIASRITSQVATDPVNAGEAWAVSYASQAPWNAVFHTTDAGETWTAVVQADVYFNSVAVSGDGATIWAAGVERSGAGRPVLYVLRDRGASVDTVPLAINLGGTATLVRVLAVDPADAGTAWLVAHKEPVRALVRASAFGAQLTEELREPGDIAGVAFDATRGAVWAATQTGLKRKLGAGAFAPAGGLPTAQCVYARAGAIWACSSNVAPAHLVVARSDDGGETFRRVFKWDDTAGPFEGCPAGTPVAEMCPALWQLYAERLGVTQPKADGGVDGGMGIAAGGCSCAIGRR